MQRLTYEWAKWSPDKLPFILEADEEVLSSARSLAATAPMHTNWKEVYSQSEHGKPGDRKLHLGLVPQPFCGDVLNAEIYILMLNPGYGSHDYFAELEVPAYREATLSNLRQEFDPEGYPFYFLNPEFAWSGGYVWWHRKFAFIIDEISTSTGMSYADARKYLSQKIACIELVPYHSTSFHDPAGWTKKLESAKLAREFVNNYVLPKAQRNEAILIVTRQAREWSLPEHSNITVYSNGEARSAHLSPASRGGRVIIERLTSTSKLV